MRLQVYYRFADWRRNDGTVDPDYWRYSSPITKSPVLLYDSWDPDKNKKIVNANLHMEESASGNFEFSIPRTHPYYQNDISLLIDSVYVIRDGRLIWDGRPTKESRDFDGTKTIYCEGALAYFNDTLLNASSIVNAQTLYDFMYDSFLDSYNRKILIKTDDGSVLFNDRLFYETASMIIDDPHMYYWNINHEVHMEWLKNQILNNFQARCKVVYPDDAVEKYLLNNIPIPRYLCLNNNLESEEIAKRLPTKRIDFGRNMLSYSYSKEINEDFGTSILPRGETVDDTSNQEFKKYVSLDGSGYLEDNLDAGDTVDYREAMFKDQRKYGVLSKVLDFQNIKTKTTLKRCAKDRYRNIRKTPFNETIEISAAELEDYIPAEEESRYSPVVQEPIDCTVAASTAIREYQLYSKWPTSILYRYCDPKYYDIWTRVIAKSKPHFTGTKTWYITALDIPFDNPYNGQITLQNNPKTFTDKYISSGAQIGDVAGAFIPSE